jgi:Protein kinase domain
VANDPQKFGDYHLLELIATGGMAEVYRARAYGLAGFEKTLVIKKILPELARDREFIELFIDEAKIAVQLVHGNIVQVFELNQVDGQYFMALEYVQGLDLARLISRARNRGPFPLPLALFVVAEILKALSFAHQRTDDDHRPLHIVHCDISPQNVLISFAGEVKITDFGISRAAFQAKSLPDVIRGKHAYMSPEQIDGQHLDGRSDIFSVGIVMYELLTGRRLFKGKSREDTMDRVRRAEVPPPRAFRPEMSPDLEEILLRALAPRPTGRYETAGDMLDDLRGLMVREGHRASNNDLAAYVRAVLDNAPLEGERRASDSFETVGVVVVACEAVPLPRTLATHKASLSALTHDWSAVVSEAGGEIWEQSDGTMLICWLHSDLRPTFAAAVRTVAALQRVTLAAGYRLSAGVAPGVARIDSETQRPSEGWELAGPFYLARWMMNLSAHRGGRALVTEVGMKQLPAEVGCSVLGRISIQGNCYINLYEVG